jgi:YD repeat-containing protein
LADNKAIGGKIFEYSTFSGAFGNIYKPKIELSLNTDIPIANCQQIHLDNQNNLVYDSRYAPSINYDKYDTKGNLLEAHKENDTHISYIWGYSKTYPVIKAENATVDDLTSAVSLSLLEYYLDEVLGDMTAEEPKLIWRGLNNTLRSNPGLANALVTTYTYKPLVGITSSTDPAGIATYYEYDAFNRLSVVRDSDFNIIKTYDYHYSTQTKK